MALNVGNFILNDWTYILIALVIVYIVKYYFSWYTRENPIPGTFPLPLIGNLHQLGLDMGKGALKLQKEYGDMFEIFLGPTRAIFLSRAELTEKINNPMLKNNAFSIRSPPNPGLKELHLTEFGIIFNRDLTAWKFNRRILNQTVMSPKFLRKNVEFTNQICDDLEKYWSSIDPNTKVDFAKWITWTLS
ncbi:287_t:CDS:1 [Funneliformis geosporum]|uniref:8930_t:CDS:1 n=1 Tax=Funneliformis geosporum TaxID=1117311 RepID=A0A9W4SBR7_9GLOM|nr:8930_t:CDS:1 [Funneliformis geosporum]CAI2184972.1 287_t:CDS:1 [Funneliformis geosporum]